MQRAIIYTRTGKRSPSSNYRILQFLPDIDSTIVPRQLAPEFLYVKHAGVKGKLDKLIWYSLYYLAIQWNLTRYMIMDLINTPTCIVIQRAISPKMILPWNTCLLSLVLKKCKNVIWDFDDHIFACGEITNKEKDILFDNVNSIVVTSEFLKKQLPGNLQEKVVLLPTTDGCFAKEDVGLLINNRIETYDSGIELLWLATGTGLPFLERIISTLDEAAKKVEEEKNKKVVLHVVCNKSLDYKPSNIVIDNVVWTPQRAKEMTERSHIGIMPLIDNEFTQGKGGFKLVQYMSSGLPVIASAVGFNKEIVINRFNGQIIDDKDNPSGWIESVLELATNKELYARMSKNARATWDEKFSYEKAVLTWRKLIG